MQGKSDIRREFEGIYSIFTGPHTQDQPQIELEEVFSSIQHVIDGLEATSSMIASGDYQGALDELRTALGSTNCAACKKAIERSLVDVEYVSKLCDIGDDDCRSGAEKLQDRVDSLTVEMKTEFEALKKEVEPDA